MEFIRGVTEDEVIAEFLSGEFSSERFSEAIHSALTERGLPNSVITHFRTDDVEENEIRRDLLTETRGYGSRTELFDGFPAEVAWSEVQLSRQNLSQVKYINYSYWTELTNGSRSPVDAARTIESGAEIFGVSNERFIVAAKAVKSGVKFPKPILVKDSSDKLVILEGHLRFTAYALARNEIPLPLSALLGTSPGMSGWSLF